MTSQAGTAETGPQANNEIWEGENKIVVGIDIGTTQSGVAFTYLVKGGKQIMHRVTQWPGQVANSQTTKIPTVVWYDNKKAVSFGAEALSRDTQLDAEENGWVLAENFKLHLHPAHMRTDGMELDPLPEGVPLSQIYSDFMGYLCKQTKTYFEGRILDGKAIWEKYMPTMEVILAHPNGWDARQQSFLRNAVVECGVFNPPGTTIAKKIQFVTEAEASVHYCIKHTNLSDQLNVGARFAVCDAGGSTVDTTLYRVTSTQPVLQLEEVRASASIQSGGIFVNGAFKARLHKGIEELELDGEEVDEYTKAGIEDFEFTTKRSFDYDNPGRMFNLKVAGDRTKRGGSSNTYRIFRGCVKVPSSEIKECFDVCVDPITTSVDGQLRGSDVGYILLVGGFGDSPYLRNVLKHKYERQHIQVTLANDSTSKAVADGAVIWSMIRSVIARAPRYSFGVICSRACIPWMEDLQGRQFHVGPGGMPIVSGAWSPVVRKGVPVAVDEVCRRSYTYTCETDNPESISLSNDLYAYSGEDKPDWGWDDSGNLLSEFRKVGSIEAQMWDVEGTLEHQEGLCGGLGYWKMSVDVCIRFGGTELETWAEWKQNGVIRTGPASLVVEDTIDT
ncbi:hypothetical protein FRC11_013766 [Ceratobasidium sp. 423]|nr:hypothetical protein FRC11_013766 [Ceratobasidium sp. 423]